MGGCAMGQPHSAVTDCYGRVHGVPWLRVAYASLFPDNYRAMVLAPGDSEDAATLIERFLGRRPSDTAYKAFLLE